MAEPAIALVEVDEELVKVTAAPAYAPAVTLHAVRVQHPGRHAKAWRVSRDPEGTKVITYHDTREQAIRGALWRARRYVAAYAVNRRTT